MSMGMNISAGTIMAYMDLDMSSFNSAIDMAGEQLSGFASGGVAGALGSIGAAAETAGRALTMHIRANCSTWGRRLYRSAWILMRACRTSTA